MNFKNKMIALGATVVVAGGLGVVTVTAQADAGIVPASTYTSSAKVAKGKDKPKVQPKQTTETSQSNLKKPSVQTGKQTHASASSAKHQSAAQEHRAAAAKSETTAASHVSAASHTEAASSAAAQPAATSQSTSAQPQANRAGAQPAAAASQAPVQTAQQKPAASQPQAQPAAPAVQTPAQKAAAKAASIRATTGETYVGTISGAGHSTDVVQGSMSRTTAPAQPGLAMTWGGATRLSTTDGLTTEIAGHARSLNFSWIMNLGIGSTVTVTDSDGNTRSYRVYATDDVNDDSYSVRDGKDQWNAITSASQGEAVVLQTCISDTVNRIVWAR